MLLKVALFLCVLHCATLQEVVMKNADCNDDAIGGLCGDPCGTGRWMINADGDKICCPICEDSVSPVGDVCAPSKPERCDQEQVNKPKSSDNVEVVSEETGLSVIPSTVTPRTGQEYPNKSVVTASATNKTLNSLNKIEVAATSAPDEASPKFRSSVTDSTAPDNLHPAGEKIILKWLYFTFFGCVVVTATAGVMYAFRHLFKPDESEILKGMPNKFLPRTSPDYHNPRKPCNYNCGNKKSKILKNMPKKFLPRISPDYHNPRKSCNCDSGNERRCGLRLSNEDHIVIIEDRGAAGDADAGARIITWADVEHYASAYSAGGRNEAGGRGAGAAEAGRSGAGGRDWAGDVGEAGGRDWAGNVDEAGGIDWDGNVDEAVDIDWAGDVDEAGGIDGFDDVEEAGGIDWAGNVDEAGGIDWAGNVDEAGGIDWDGNVDEAIDIDWDGDVDEAGGLDGAGDVDEAGGIDGAGEVNEAPADDGYFSYFAM